MRKVTHNPQFWYNPNAEAVYDYAVGIIDNRWPEAELYIMKDPKWAFYYALHTIKSRWEKAEPYIMKNPYYAYYYALYVIKSRWLEAEPFIQLCPACWNVYKNAFGIKE